MTRVNSENITRAIETIEKLKTQGINQYHQLDDGTQYYTYEKLLGFEMAVGILLGEEHPLYAVASEAARQLINSI